MRTILTLTMLLVVVPVLMAQPPSGDRGSRGGDSSGRGGGSPGGGFPGGGFPGGGPGGGFPGGGFPGGGFPGGGGFGARGNDSGGSRGGAPESMRGGPPSGDRGSRGSSSGTSGGFNPAEMLKRFDRNGNNMIDPDEATGPAQFFLQRLAQNNPKIDLKKPIPISVLTEEMERARSGGSSSESSSPASNSRKEPELLVPDFRLSSEPMPVEGFGAGSSIFNVKVEERDLKEAEDRLKRYDTNKDGLLSAEELKAGRWSDDPMQYDRNRDGKLNKSELAMRYANRRVEEQSRRGNTNDTRSRSNETASRGGWVRSREEEQQAPEVDRFGDAKSYRLPSSSSKLSGLPDFFARSDADGDGQVLMSEFSSSWNQEILEEFLKWDLNRDGIITQQECLAALASGVRVSGSTSSSSSSSSAVTSPKPATSSGSASSGNASEAQMEWAKRQIAKYDTNGDGQLTANEWEKMIIKPTGADSNGDGVITAEEYAAFRAK